MKNLPVITAWLLLPITVYASTSIFESASTVIENRKGTFILEDEHIDEFVDEVVTDEIISTTDDSEQAYGLISTSEELDLVVDDTTPNYEDELITEAVGFKIIFAESQE